MPGERRPSPDTQVRASLEQAKRAGLGFDEAWRLAVRGQVCDSYSSARGARMVRASDQLGLSGPPNLRGSAGQKRCAGCSHVRGAGVGLAQCGLYDAPVFPGVLWPHRTEERKEWQDAITSTSSEWGRSYRDEPSPVAALITMLVARLVEAERSPDIVTGTIAA